MTEQKTLWMNSELGKQIRRAGGKKKCEVSKLAWTRTSALKPKTSSCGKVK